MALKFGTSGVRGLVTEMTDRVCYLYMVAFINYAKSKAPLQSVAIAGDLRSSTPRIVESLAFAVRSEGLKEDYCGYIPTQALVHYSMQKSVPGAMVTGSHIPDDRNGIKFNLPWGEILKKDEVVITEYYNELVEKDKTNRQRDSYPFDQFGMFKPHISIQFNQPLRQALKDYVDRYLNYFSPGGLANLKIVNYQHSAVGRDILPDILRGLGAEVIDVGRSEKFIPVDTEAIENPEQLKEWVQQYDANALVSADGDSDRPLLIDELGNYVRGDILGILVSQYLQAESVSLPVSCNTALELSRNFKDIRRTRIGSPYVIQAMNEAIEAGYKNVVGYEANGGFLTASDFTHEVSRNVLNALPTRDAILPILSVLYMAKQSQKPISQLVSKLPKRFTFSGLLRNFPTDKARIIIEQIKTGQVKFATKLLSSHFGHVSFLDFTDGARVAFENGDIIHFRPSGNAPEFRCYTESETENRAKRINEDALKLIEKFDVSQIEINETKNNRQDSAIEHQRLANIDMMVKTASKGLGMEIIIVSTTNGHQEKFWQERLEKTRGQIANSNALILVVHEDWPGGAGNGLGTLYALVKANKKAQNLYKVDILDKLSNGASIGLYHTAGKGTRLAPLPGSEVNNKPGVKLPGLVRLGSTVRPVTLLESVIKQTSVYASSRKGRVSVFWGDQIFIPSVDINYKPVHHVDILCQLGKMPDHPNWEKNELDKYGLIAVGDDGTASQIEKISYETATRLIRDGIISVENGIGISLGSFSISAEMTKMLLEEFNAELKCRKGKYDADPHFWMPLTLNQNTYLDIMSRKGIELEASRKHYIRIQKFKERFLSKYPDAGIFGAVNIGEGSYWWDYGNVKAYMKNTMKLAAMDGEAEAMRQFFGVLDPCYQSSIGSEVKMEQSYVINSRINRGKIKNSLIIGINTDYLEARDSVVIMGSAPKIIAKSSLLYNFLDDKELVYDEKTLRVDCMLSDSTHYTMMTTLDRDGGQDWKVKLPDNTLSYEELYNLNQNVDIAAVESLSERKHNEIVQNVFKK